MRILTVAGSSSRSISIDFFRCVFVNGSGLMFEIRCSLELIDLFENHIKTITLCNGPATVTYFGRQATGSQLHLDATIHPAREHPTGKLSSQLPPEDPKLYLYNHSTFSEAPDLNPKMGSSLPCKSRPYGQQPPSIGYTTPYPLCYFHICIPLGNSYANETCVARCC